MAVFFVRGSVRLKNGKRVEIVRPRKVVERALAGHQRSAHQGKFKDDCQACGALRSELEVSDVKR